MISRRRQAATRRPFLPLMVLVAALLALLQPLAPAHARPAMPALVFDLDTGKVLLAHDAGQPWYPASLTKLMTAWLVMNEVNAGRLSFDDVMTISRRVVNGVQRGAAKYGARPGQRMTIGTMLTFLMVRSDADMALALAEAVAGNEAAFVQRMNTTARRLGMTATRFTNPHGMHHPSQITTARDMALLARDIYARFLRRHPSWWRFFSLRTVDKTVLDKKGQPRRRTLKNRNHLLFMMPEADGMKTGFLCASGFNLLATARRGGVRLGTVVFGRRTAYNRASVARILLEEGFRRARAGQRGRLDLKALRNVSAQAPNMTHGICRTRVLPRVAEQALRGWSVLLGPFRSPVRAVAATEAELLAADLLDAVEDSYGVTRLTTPLLRQAGMAEKWRAMMAGRKRRPAPAGGLVWNLREGQAVELCRRARLHGTGCAIQSPRELATLRKLLPRDKKPRATAQSAAPKPRKRPARLNIRPRTASTR